MTTLSTIFLTIQARLQERVSQLKYTDKDWGQLRYPQPAVQFPCVLLDSGNIGVSQVGRGAQLRQVDILLTVANQRLRSSSGNAPGKEEAYETLDLLEAIFDTLQGFGTEVFSGLVFSAQRRIILDSVGEVYQVIYKTQYVRESPKRLHTVSARPELKVE